VCKQLCEMIFGIYFYRLNVPSFFQKIFTIVLHIIVM